MTKQEIVCLCLVIFLLGGVIGAGAEYIFGPRITLPGAATEKTIEKPVVVYQDRIVHDTKIQYVPAETVKVDGKDTKLDGKFQIGKPTFNYTLNGKIGQFAKADDEQYVFDKNMLEVRQSSQVDINVTVPTVDKTKKNFIGIGGGHGLGIIAGMGNSWLYVDTQGAKAGGMTFKF